MQQAETNVDATAAPAQPDAKPSRSRLRRWARRLGLTMLVVLVVLAAGHAWWGHRAAARLESHLAAARAAGDPLTVEELNRWPAARAGSGANVVPVLRAAAEAIDTDSEAWQQFESSGGAAQILGISRAVDYQPGVVSHLVAIGIASYAVAVAAERVFPETLPWENQPGDEPPADSDEQNDEAAQEQADQASGGIHPASHVER